MWFLRFSLFILFTQVKYGSDPGEVQLMYFFFSGIILLDYFVMQGQALYENCDSTEIS